MEKPRALPLKVLAVAVLSACTQFPALERTITPELEAAEYPALVPVDPLLARVNLSDANPSVDQALLRARVAALQARAARLRRGVLSRAERQRLDQEPQ